MSPGRREAGGRLRLARAMIAIAALAATLAACGGPAGASSGAGGIVLYNGQHLELTSALVAAFTKQTGIQVRVRTNDGIVLADQILQEGSASPADVYLSENSPELVELDQHHLLGRLSHQILAQVPAQREASSGDWVGIALRVGVVAYDPALISAARLPQSVLDFAQPSWKGKIAIAPTDSDFPPLVGAVIATYGQRAAVRWLAGLKRNALLYQTDEAVVAAVNSGDVAAGLINNYYWYRLRVEVGAGAMHSALYYFPGHDPGSVVNISGAAVLASSRHRSQALAFVRFLVSPAAQQIIAGSYDFEYPARPGIQPNSQLPALDSISADTFSPLALGNDQTASRLIQQAGLA
jgi:iron(III) transport system substrate-binding protein